MYKSELASGGVRLYFLVRIFKMPNLPEDDEFYEDLSSEFELIKFSPEVQNAIEQVNA